MGLFTNRCINPDCRHRVRKGSQFCPVCGSPAPKGLTVCGSCKAEVSSASKFCWRCGADLSKVAKPFIFDDRWARRPEDFAVRVDDQDVKGWLSKPLIIEHGTRALLFQAGKFKGEVGEGRYDIGGFLKRLNHFMIDLDTSVVLTDAGDVTIDLENAGLWTSDHFEVGTIGRLVLRIADADAMFVNLFKGANRIGVDDLEQQLAGETQMLLSGIVAGHKAEALFTDLDIRNQIESQLRETILPTLGRLGLELVQIRFISFAGEAYEELRQREGEVQVAGERAKLNQRLRETLTQDRMDAFKNEKDFEDFVRQTEHELGLKDVIRQDELVRLGSRLVFDRDREAILHRIEIEGIENDEAREQAWKQLLADERERDELHRRDLDRQLAEAKSLAEKRRIELDIERLEHAEDMRQAEDGIRLLRQVKDVEHEQAVRQQELEAKTLEARSKATAEALLSIVDGPVADRIAQLESLRARQNMSPDQILALAAEASPQAAEALARKYEADGRAGAELVEQLRQQLAQVRETDERHADRMERLTRVALSQMGDVAGTRARPVEPTQTVVAGTGAGRPIVINPPGSVGQCAHCGAGLEGDGQFCPQCGAKQ